MTFTFGSKIMKH